ncbi:tyrosine-type recombinase/integrase [Lysinibacillus sp. NPDC048646]|uniref:site-specific integrase n=1 Tax=Lysinibacillus sp. NPDC048646 TaxID=3390574 RepID=UPI003D03F9C7
MVKVKLYKSTKEPEIYHYFNAGDEKLWMFRHKYYDSFGKRKEKKKSGFKTEKSALKALLEVKASTLRGQTKHIENENLTVSDWLHMWYAENKKDWSIKTLVQRESAIRLQMKPLLGRYKLQKLDKATYQREFINVLEKRYAPSMLKLLHSLFKIAINAAVEAEVLDRNRFTRVKLVDDAKIENFLTPVQLVTFLEDAKNNENITSYTFLLTVAYTGLRCGEACGLQWKDIDFENNTITIARSRGQYGVGKTKTKNSDRTIFVDPLVIDQLETYRKWCKKKLLSCGKKLKDVNDDSFIFISEHLGEPISTNNTNLAIKRIIQRTNLPKTTLHGLRHTHCTVLLNNKLPVKVIAERLGNTPQMVHTVYGHVLKEMEQESVTVFSQSLNAVGARIGANS